jgi:hypothetical protein
VRRDWEGQSLPLSQARRVPRRVATGHSRPKGAILTEHGSGSPPGFEIEAATVQEFLRLLKERERGELASKEPRSLLRRAVFVARMLDQRSSRFGYPLVTRYVVAAFTYGTDLVCCRRTTSHAVEVPDLTSRTEDRQRTLYEEMKAEVARGVKDANIGVPLYEGCLRRAADSDVSARAQR